MLTTIILTALFAGRAIAQATGVYAPYYTNCPSDLKLVRKPRGLSTNESNWVHGRKLVVAEAISSYLGRLDLTGFNLTEYTTAIQEDPDYNTPVLAWATSCGGWRSGLTGAGAQSAIDERTPGANEAKIGGLFQSLTYITGLSGGSWPTASWAFSKYAPMDQQIQDWHVNINRFSAADYSEFAAPVSAYFDMIAEKVEAGFNVSVADFLGHGFAYEAVPGVNRTWSSISELQGFQNFSGPMPFLFEWGPFEFGSWDFGFVPMKYIGTVPNENNTAEQCVENLDQASFVLGCAASAWNSWWLEAISNGTLGAFSKRELLNEGALKKRAFSLSGYSTLSELNDAFNQSFGYSLPQISNPSIPNPFGGDENITFADGAEAHQAVPFWPLIQPERKVDFIFAWDDGADDRPYLWNNGTNLWGTYNKAKQYGLPFPRVPPVSTMLARNYTLRPTLFGCNSSLTTTGDSSSPIVAYFAGAPYSMYSNYSWTVANMSYTELNDIFENSFNVVSQGNDTLSASWTTCLGCAVIDRSLERMGISRPDVCEQCFQEYCWDGTTTDLAGDFVLDPVLMLDSEETYAEWNSSHPYNWS